MTAKIVAEAAADGNQIAREVLEHACRVLGWGIAQMITLISPGVVVVGGGVSLMDASLFLAPLRREVERYVFPPQIGHYHIEPAGAGRTGRRSWRTGGRSASRGPRRSLAIRPQRDGGPHLGQRIFDDRQVQARQLAQPPITARHEPLALGDIGRIELPFVERPLYLHAAKTCRRR